MSYNLRIIISIWVTLLGKPVKSVLQKLNEMYGSIENAWFSEENLWERVSDEKLRKKALDIYEECIKNNIKIVLSSDVFYPKHLKEIESSPYLLYYKGQLPAEANVSEEMLLSVVGSRRCTSYGRINAYNFSKSLAECGLGIVSGMARGIDAQAHKGALFAKGYTIAVLGSGLRNVYPKEHLKLFEEIAENGCVISEFPPETPPFKNNFPARNRIISGFSQGLLVVEASEKSGAMITVNFALEEGRSVYAIPGNINSEKSYGCNFLIKQGALCVTSYADILEEYNIVCDSAEKRNEWIKGLEGGEADVVNALLDGCFTANEICKKTERNMGNDLSALTRMEIKGIVTKDLDGAYSLKM